jgi:hypothetical protein
MFEKVLLACHEQDRAERHRKHRTHEVKIFVHRFSQKKARPCCGRVQSLRYRTVVGAGAVVVGAAGMTVGEVWPIVVRGVELLVAGVELLSAVRLWPHGPNSINAPMITTAAIIAAIGPLAIPLLRLSRPVRLLGVRLLNAVWSSGPIWLSKLLIFVLQKLNGENP